MNGILGNVFFEQLQKVQDPNELFGLLLLTLIAIVGFRFLIATAEALMVAVGAMVRALTGVVLPVLLVLLLLLFALSRL